MAGSRPTNEEARRMGVVPYSGSNSGKLNGNSNVNTSLTPSPETVTPANATTNRAVPQNFSTSNNGNDQLWNNGGSQNYQQNWQQPTAAAPQYNGNGGPPPNKHQSTAAPQYSSNGGAPPNWQYQPTNPQSQTRPVSPQGSSNNWPHVQGVPMSYGQNGGYVQGPQPGNQSHRPNFQAPQGGYIDQGPPKGPIPKGDYVYYDGNGNQIQPVAPPYMDGPQDRDNGSGSENHHHHHYFYHQQPQQLQQPVGFPNNKKLEQKKKRHRGAYALAAALIACWACTCCCHAPCGC